jgi:hypothetical protein
MSDCPSRIAYKIEGESSGLLKPRCNFCESKQEDPVAAEREKTVQFALELQNQLQSIE